MAYKPKAIEFLKKTLGEEGFEALEKFELYKKTTNTTLNPDEIRIALQVVPRTVLSFLQKELGSMKENEGKKIKIPVEQEAYLEVTKFANDVYSGDISQQGKIISSFKYRSLPGVGLTILSGLELYDMVDLNHIGRPSFEENSKDVQSIIDDRLNLRDLVSKVVDKKLSEREAIEQMVKDKLSQMLFESKEESNKIEEPKMSEKKEKQPLKLKQFIEKKAQKKSNPSYTIKMEKNENVNCPDCGKQIFNNSGFSGCICFGLDRNKKIHIRKSEDRVELSFSNTWDKENIEMLLEVLKERNNGSEK